MSLDVARADVTVTTSAAQRRRGRRLRQFLGHDEPSCASPFSCVQAVESEHCTMCSSLGGSSTAGSDYVLFPVFVEAVASTVVAADRVYDPFIDVSTKHIFNESGSQSFEENVNTAVSQVVHAPVPQNCEDTVEVATLSPHEPISERIFQQNADILVPTNFCR